MYSPVNVQGSGNDLESKFSEGAYPKKFYVNTKVGAKPTGSPLAAAAKPKSEPDVIRDSDVWESKGVRSDPDGLAFHSALQSAVQSGKEVDAGVDAEEDATKDAPARLSAENVSKVDADDKSNNKRADQEEDDGDVAVVDDNDMRDRDLQELDGAKDQVFDSNMK